MSYTYKLQTKLIAYDAERPNDTIVLEEEATGENKVIQTFDVEYSNGVTTPIYIANIAMYIDYIIIKESGATNSGQRGVQLDYITDWSGNPESVYIGPDDFCVLSGYGTGVDTAQTLSVTGADIFSSGRVEITVIGTQA